jgi:hypothetical protein
MWQSFLQSMALLAVAMGTALFSSATSASDNLPATIISALVSLLLAGWVGVRLVPRLARGVDWGWMPGLAQYKITREGGIFLVALFVVLAAAINTSNNLLYMVLSALLAVLVLSGILSAMNFKALDMELLLPARAFAGEPLPFSIRIRNRTSCFSGLLASDAASRRESLLFDDPAPPIGAAPRRNKILATGTLYV